MKYKISDKVRIKATNEIGDVLEIEGDFKYRYLVKIDSYNYWFREAELCDPAPVKVGDVFEKNGVEVMEIFEKFFIDTMGRLWTFEEIKNWKIKTPDTCPHCGQVKEK